MTPEQKRLARHALGLPNNDKRSYRNRFMVYRNHPEWTAMVGAGLAETDGYQGNKGPDDSAWFWLTTTGAAMVLEPGERLCAEDFPPTEQDAAGIVRPIYTAPIMMSAPMVRGCLRQVRGEPGGKTVTRRMPTKGWDALERHFEAGDRCRLWVRETWMPHSTFAGMKPSKIPPSNVFFAADDRYHPSNCPWVPCIHMPRWASRLALLDVTVRRERLGDITEDDARAEGMIYSDFGNYIPQGKASLDGGKTFHPFRPRQHDGWHFGSATRPDQCWGSARAAYAGLWDHLHGLGSWERDADTEVMVITFRPVLANIDKLEAV